MSTHSPIWQPSQSRIDASQMEAFRHFVNDKLALTLSDYQQLHRWSTDHPDQFWQAIWQFSEVIGTPGQRLLLDGDKMPGARFFPDARLNFAENLLRYQDDRIALVFRDEAANRVALSYNELYHEVARLAHHLRHLGVVAGDRVAAFMPNRIETVVTMLAAASLGATFSSCSPDFGFNGVLDRFGQIQPKVLVAANGYRYNGKVIDCSDKIAQIADAIGSLQQVIVVPAFDAVAQVQHPLAIGWHQALDNPARSVSFTPLPFDHPLYVLYSSGTTGQPKCIVHGAGGTLLQHLKELRLHTDIQRRDVLFYFTTCGWMMWNWLISGLATGATLVLYDGSPFAPGPEVLWQLAEQEEVSVFGTSAKYIAALEKAGYRPAEHHRLTQLKGLLSTGSPLAHEGFDFVYRHIHPDLCLSSISGGTDIVSCFALGNPIKPVYRGQLQSPGLGMKVEVYNEQGQPLQQQKGELVCTTPFVSMPIGFWGDDDGSNYHHAYFDRFDNVWAHGDYAETTAEGGLIIHGRSDAVLNPGGVRIGTAEIYRQVEKVDQVQESLAIGQQWQDDVRVVLFVVLKPGTRLTDALQQQIRTTIRANTTPRHVPAKIIQVQDLPKTLSGKLVELAVRKVVHGQAVTNTDALANPESLQQFKHLPDLQC
ncbi:acetoacetate--CoA ligase [Ferrimonas sp. SCSIO 43195]|uniref:acetoacetate--CoA ligase n=1 Tax=Ferrimonas sp. SCSIO 43195 TaxID=2822844 RepID=UPI002075780A|nr:acetoacetate--CoA ligase [Ferrimonas sp. SCSIO 43195]USD36743.1 acetoacetate--CoA ligase [Ferrimonas sp. SCSIO 43195]